MKSKITYLGIFFLLFLMTSLTAQKGFQVQNYEGILPVNKKIIYDYQFKTDKNDWKSDDTTKKIIQVENGFLVINSKRANINECRKTVFNENEDFEIELRIKYKSGNTKRSFGLIWGNSDDSKRYFSFTVNANGMFAINKFTGAYISYIQPVVSDYANYDDFNKLTLRKVDKYVYFFLNEKLVHSMQYFMSFGSNTGIIVAADLEVLVDYLKICKLDLSIKNNPPEITITEPKHTNYYAGITSTTKTLKISGKVKDEEPIKEVMVNGTTVKIGSNGSFSTEISGLESLNKIKITATDNQKVTTEEYITLTRSVEEIKTNATQDTILNDKYYALIIAVGDYKDTEIPRLSEPLKDAQKLKEILTTYYSFEEANVQLLKNSTRKDIIIALDEISMNITEKDNLLIFYAGHGYWEKRRDLGFWLPSDSEFSNTANWIMNSTLQTYISIIPSRHTLLITDACFGGSIFRTRSGIELPMEIKETYDLPSRKAMTSGNLETVPDQSLFLKYLCERLKNNTKKYITSTDLFKVILPAVESNSNTHPQFGTIKNAGDQGGDFIFIKR
jgi:hypothetical protein